jgi:hypothetical protein
MKVTHEKQEAVGNKKQNGCTGGDCVYICCIVGLNLVCVMI